MPQGTAQYPTGRRALQRGKGGWHGTVDLTRRPNFISPKFYGSFIISGVTRDSVGTPLGNCAVHLFESATDIEVSEVVSDGSGNFTFNIGNNAGFFYIVAYKAGSPDVSGTTLNTLVAV
jgi:hypothetical protein